jgi:hypothetical protein
MTALGFVSLLAVGLSYRYSRYSRIGLLLVAVFFALLSKPLVTLAGRPYLLFDVGGMVGIVGMSVALLWAIVKHTAYLYRTDTANL